MLERNGFLTGRRKFKRRPSHSPELEEPDSVDPDPASSDFSAGPSSVNLSSDVKSPSDSAFSEAPELDAAPPAHQPPLLAGLLQPVKAANVSPSVKDAIKYVDLNFFTL